MSVTAHHNALVNGDFTLWDYRDQIDLAAIPAVPYAANRWRVVGGTAAGTVSKGASPTLVSTPKWVRNVTAMDINVTTAGTMAVSQTMEASFRWIRGAHVLSVIVFGPADGGFTMEIAGERTFVTVEGGAEPTVAHLDVHLGDQVSDNMPVTIFKDPTLAGSYRIVLAQLTVGVDRPVRGPFIIPDPAVERARAARYAVPVSAGELIHGGASNSFMAPRFDLRVPPVFVPQATRIDAVNIRSNVAGFIDPVSWSTTQATTTGVRLGAQGATTGITATEMMLTTPRVGVLHADF